MKKIIGYFFFFCWAVSTSGQQVVDKSQLCWKDSLFYLCEESLGKRFRGTGEYISREHGYYSRSWENCDCTTNLFTGTAVDSSSLFITDPKDPKQIHSIENFKNGKRHGICTFWNTVADYAEERKYHIVIEYREGTKIKETNLNGIWKMYTHQFNAQGQQHGEQIDWTTGERIQYVHGKKHGLYISEQRHPLIIGKGTYADDKKTGKWTWRYENGRKREEGWFEDGRLHGKWTTWADDQGQKIKTDYYEHGKLISSKGYERDGSYQWGGDGPKCESGTLIGNKREGEWIYWDGKGRIICNATFKDSKLVGFQNSDPFYEGMVPRKMPYVDYRDDPGKSGYLVYVKNEPYTGKLVTFHKFGNIEAVIEVKDGIQRDETRIQYDEGGELLAGEFITYDSPPVCDSEIDTKIKTQYENGILKSKEVFKGDSTNWVTYQLYDYGRISSTYTVSEWWSNGNKRSVKSFKDKKEDGQWEYWGEYATPQKVELWEQGKLIKTEEY